MAEEHPITKYPNRRLYDKIASRYITLSDVRDLVADRKQVRVTEKKTGVDITRHILMQIMQEYPHPSLTSELLHRVVRASERHEISIQITLPETRREPA
jgi:polyhydroxyalkanoate synthesis repressor PhaR